MLPLLEPVASGPGGRVEVVGEKSPVGEPGLLASVKVGASGGDGIGCAGSADDARATGTGDGIGRAGSAGGAAASQGSEGTRMIGSVSNAVFPTLGQGMWSRLRLRRQCCYARNRDWIFSWCGPSRCPFPDVGRAVSVETFV